MTEPKKSKDILNMKKSRRYRKLFKIKVKAHLIPIPGL